MAKNKKQSKQEASKAQHPPPAKAVDNTPPVHQPTEREIELRFNTIQGCIQQASSLAKYVIVSGAIVAVVYFGVYLPISVSAGKQTTINYLINAVADFKVHIWIAWAAVAGAGALAANERRLRMRERKVKDKRIEELESAIDPDRTSSGVSVSGEGTQPTSE